MSNPQSAAALPGSSPPYLSFAGTLTAEENAEIVREVYKKHAAKLLSIEDAQQTLTLLLMGGFWCWDFVSRVRKGTCLV
jgi:hypothetical protein